MTKTQLKEVFHVDNADLVPNYELIELTHHNANLHHVGKRSYDNNIINKYNSDKNSKISDNLNSINNHHVKKDLSKITYGKSSYGNLKESSSPLDDQSPEQSQHFQQDQIQKENLNKTSSSVNLSEHNDINKEHNVSFKAFGEELKLNLKPTKGLFKDGPQSLRMWNVHSNPNGTQGLVYEEINSVSKIIN